jgi:hypothetical protein
MLRKIKLYGKLAKFIGHRVLEADVATAAEAVRFLLANWPEAEAHMNRPALPRQCWHLRSRPRRAASPGRCSTDQLRAGGSRCWRNGADYCWDCFGCTFIFWYCQSGGRLGTCWIFVWCFALQAAAFGTQAGLIAASLDLSSAASPNS